MKLNNYVRRKLRKIARNGRPRPEKVKYGIEFWPGFDDADIYCFLHDFPKADGPNFRKLRHEYEMVMKKPLPNMLYFWPFTKTQAKALLREIRETA